MSLFRRHKHTWQVKAVQNFNIKEKYIWEQDFRKTGEETIIRYVCSECHDDTHRTVTGAFSLREAKEVFPKP